MLRISRRRGFTLIEIAIVLGIVGVLGVGLWRLFSGSSQQMGDQSAASQQQQLIAAVKGYLASDPDALLKNLAASKSTALNTPSSAANGGQSGTCSGDANMVSDPGFCSFLPPGFWSGTTNAYGQTFLIRVLKDSTPAGTEPTTYSFMVLTIGGATIADTSGGRLAALIGNDGGFIYSAPVCVNPANQAIACGAYDAWSASTTGNSPGYGFAAGNSRFGHIASRTYVSPAQSSGFPWLARQLMSGDNPVTPTYNTMTTPAFLGGQTLYAGTNSGLTTGGKTVGDGAIDVQGGTIELGNGLINSAGTGPNGGITLNEANGTDNASINVTTTCKITQFNINTGNPEDVNGNPCNYAVQVNSIDASNLVNAASYYATGSFLYGSDIRFKFNVRTLGDPLDDVMRLRPVSFVYKSSGKESMGVIAQELEKVYPQLVSSGPNGDSLKYVNYGGLIAPLIGAVQELKKENDELRQEIHDQEIRENKLETELRQRLAK